LRKLPGHPTVVPKGKIEEGETASDAAIRELMEETGIDCSIIGWLGTQVIPPPQGKKRHQHAVFFLATGVETEEFASHLDADTTLVEPEHLLETIEIPELRDLLESAWPSIRLVTGTGPE
jgi:8-oxo-dGTP pyrophosphatase MutT (NUDIX family)